MISVYILYLSFVFFYLTVLQNKSELFVVLHVVEKLPTGFLFFLFYIFWREAANHLSQSQNLQDKNLRFGQDLKDWDLLILQTPNTQGNSVWSVIKSVFDYEYMTKVFELHFVTNTVNIIYNMIYRVDVTWKIAVTNIYSEHFR